MADGSGVLDGASARPLTVVGFAGGGGSSVAIRMALGVAPDLAMNHWLTAVLAHQRHFPETEHHCADIFEVDPRGWRPGERIAFAWFSPDCTDFSKAKGKAPRSERIRGLAWSIMPWLVARRPDVTIIENVEEFEQAGPVYRSPDDWRARGVRGTPGEPIKALRGQMFQRLARRVRQMGGTIEWRVVNAADFGAPTTRKRLYVIIRLDGRPIVWPERTHAPRKDAAALGLKPWRGACEIIDWSKDCPSIFLKPDEVEDLRRRTGKRVQRPLVPATQKRIARGLERYVIGSAEPFIVPITHQGDARAHGVRDPLRTITSVKGGEFALVDAGLVGLGGRRAQSPPVAPQAPFPTITGKADAALVSGTVVRTDMHQSNSRCVYDPADPLRTNTSSGGHGVASAYLVPRYGERPAGFRCEACGEVFADPHASGCGGLAPAECPRCGEEERVALLPGQAPRALDVQEPTPCPVPTGNQGSLAAVSLHQMNTRDVGGDAGDPLRTTAAREHQALQSACLVRQFGSAVGGRDAEDPLGATMGQGGHGGGHDQLISAYMAQGNHAQLGREATEPLTTLTSRSTQQQLISAHVESYYRTGEGSSGAEPLRTSTAKDRHGLVAAWLEQANTGMVGHPATSPVSTIVAGGGADCGWGGATQRLIEARLELDGGSVGRRAAVLGFLWAHFGVPTSEEWAEPTATLEARKKFGLVILGDQVWMIVDVGLRMLTPAELGAAMGLPPEYDLASDAHGRPVSKTHQTQMIGNMVSPPPAAALIAANCPHLIEQPGRPVP